MKQIKSWSFSALTVFEECPHRSKLSRIDKIPEPPRPAPPNGKEHANDRGSRIHDHAEYFVRGSIGKMCREMKSFEEEFLNLKERFGAGQVELENMWCFDQDWLVVPSSDYVNTWLRVKLDAMVFLTPTKGVVIDYKTGKKFGNEPKHAQQAQLYQLAAFLKYPELEQVTTEFWYLDQDDITKMTFSRKNGLKYWKTFHLRGEKMTNEVEFKAKPNGYSCRFCPYGPEETSNKWVTKSGDCVWGV